MRVVMGQKESLKAVIIEALTHDLHTAMNAASSARDTATSKESIAENKYDTFGLEASYLAHGQSQRALDLQQSINRYKALAFKDFHPDDAIDITCLVSLIDQDDVERWFFIGPTGGGLKVKWQTRDITVITPDTPLGSQLMGKSVDDAVELTLSNKKISYEVLEIC